MEYQDVLDFLYTQLPEYQKIGAIAYKVGLNNTLALDNYFGNPHKNFCIIHVAGTNGKGSVSHTLASGLQHAGYKVELYTSPHLKDFRERMRINGVMIPQSEVIGFVENNRKIIEEVAPSFFEMTTLMAFDWFSRSGVDVAVVEVGLGGRLDSTNIITPFVSVITNIGFDHVQMLGNTLPAIAMEKAGIIKPNVPVVVGETHSETSGVFIAKAEELNAPICFADTIRSVVDICYRDGKQMFKVAKSTEVEYETLLLDLMGIYQRKNILTVLATIDVLRRRFSISDTDVINGVQSVVTTTGLKGRWQQLAQKPATFCDIGHNEDGIREVVEQLKRHSYHRLHIVMGMVNDKDLEKVMVLLPKDAIYYFTNAAIERALKADLLQAKAAEFGLHGDCYPSVAQAIEAAKQNATPNDLIYIGGSAFVVAEIPEL